MADRATILAQIAADIADNGPDSITPAKDKAIRDNVANSYANLTDELITQAVAIAGTDTSPKLITAAILKAAIEAIGIANQSFQDLLSAVGLNENDQNFASFSGNLLSSDASAKTLFQELETAVENVSGGNGLLLPPVNDTQGRNDLTGLVAGNTVLVRDDGDGKWAVYQVDAPGDGTGSNATWLKISDQDVLENAISAASIRTAYLSNSGTEEFTTALKTKLDSITVGEAGYILNYANVGAAPTSGIPTGARTFIGGELYEFDGTNWVMDTADLSSLGSEIVSAINTELGGTDWQGGGSGGGSTDPTASINFQENIFNLNNVHQSITLNASIEWDNVAPDANRLNLSSPRDSQVQGATINTVDIDIDESGKFLILANCTHTASSSGGKFIQIVKNGTDLLAVQAAGDTIMMNNPVFWYGDLLDTDKIDIRLDGQFAGTANVFGFTIVAVKLTASAGSGGGSTEYLPNFADIPSAPTSGVNTGAWTIIADLPHKFNGTTWEPDYVSSSGISYTDATGGFAGSDRTDWIESSGDLVSIKDLKSAQLFVPTNAGDILYNTANDYISSNTGVDSKLDINNGDSGFLSPGSGSFTIISVLHYTASNSDRHIKFQNNGGANTYKVNPTGIEIRNSGNTTETIPYTFSSGITYFYAIQRLPNGFHRLYVGTTENDVQLAGESTAASTTDLGGLNEVTMGDTERCHMFLIFHEYLSESSINGLFEQAKTDFTLG